KTLAVAGGESGFLTFWDAVKGRTLRTVEVGQPVYALAWSPDGSTLACSGRQLAVQLYDVSSARLLRTLGPANQDFYSVAWAPDGQSLAGGGKATTYLWEAESGKALQAFAGAGHAVAWGPDGQTLASTTAAGAVQLWEP